MHKSSHRFAFAAAALAVLSLSACGGNSVGSKDLFKNQGNGKAALGSEPSPSPSAAAPTVAPVQSAAPAAPVVAPTHSQPPPPPPPKPQAQKFAIAVNGDNSGQPQYNPPAAKVYTGTIITFTNKDTVPRSVVSDTGAFSSGNIAPGGTWTYTAATVGTFNYHDGTRPYAVAYFQVVTP